MIRRLFSLGILAFVTFGMLPGFAHATHSSYFGQTWNELRCDGARSPMNVSVSVTPFVHQHDEHGGRWQLWVANDTAWNYGNWAENSLARSTGPDAGGYLCAKRGDLLKINGSFAGGDMYLVYKRSSPRSGADQITGVRIAGRLYDIGDRCWWGENGMGGYDLMCKVR